MANNYIQATVQPNFPISSVTEFEKELLNRYGFYITHADDSIYCYAEEYLTEVIEPIEDHLISEYAAKGDPIAVKLLEYIQEHGSDELDSYISSEFHWQYIFQEILKKPECEGIEDICVEGSYTCDYTCGKPSPGEFGGFVCRITRDFVQDADTSTAFERMKKEPEFLAALDIVWELASGNCLEDDLVDDDSDLLEEQSRQKKALALIHDYVVNHPLAG